MLLDGPENALDLNSLAQIQNTEVPEWGSDFLMLLQLLLEQDAVGGSSNVIK